MASPNTKSPIDRLIIVCCHAIWLGGPSNGHDETEWAIEPFQRGETPTFIAHIKAGLKVLSEEPNSLLVFAGGPTKPDRTSRCEGESYMALARANAHFSLPLDPQRITHEPHSTDSYQNILFSLLLFLSLTFPSQSLSPSPTHLTIISHAFKRPRFLSLHLPALKFPLERVKYVGIDPPVEGERGREELEEGERVRGWGVWRGDLYGVGSVLGEKRCRRGWREGREEDVLGGLEGLREGEKGVLRSLVAWRGGGDGREVFPERLPWEKGSE